MEWEEEWEWEREREWAQVIYVQRRQRLAVNVWKTVGLLVVVGVTLLVMARIKGWM